MNWTLVRIRPARRRLRLETLESRQLLASISGVAWHDLDSSGIRDTGEPSLGGWTAYLDIDNNRQFDAGEPNMLTSVDDLDTPGVDEGGMYSFDSLAAGDYVVRMVERPLWQATHPLEANPNYGRLAFVASLKNGEQDIQSQTVEGLEAGVETAISADGSDLYVVSDPTFNTQALNHFRIDRGTGQLVFQRSYFQGGDDGHGNTIDAVGDPKEVHISPDGKFVYINSGGRNSLAIFSRNLFSGELTFVDFLSDGGTDAVGNPTPRIDTLRSATISADGAFLYASADSFFDKAINVFSRDSATGGLTLVQTILDDATNHLGGLADLALSADGNHLYAASQGGHAITHFMRNSVTGELTFVGEILNTEVEEITNVVGLKPSADNNFLYAISQGDNTIDDAVAVFSRDPATGVLTLASSIVNNGTDSAGTPVTNLTNPRDLELSADGQHLYVTATTNDGGAIVFQRNQATGELAVVEVVERGGTDYLGTDAQLREPLSVAATPDGRFVFVTDQVNFLPHSVISFDREHLDMRSAAHLVTLGASDNFNAAEFGFVSLAGEIVGTKWHDLNRNGQRDAAEPALENWTVYLDLNNNGQRDDGEPVQRTAVDNPSTTTIDETGTYRFSELFPGEYVVAEELPARWEQIHPGGSSVHSVSVEAGLPMAAYDFGNKRIEDISGTKWFDENGNGVRDLDLSISPTADIVFTIDVSASSLDHYDGESIGDPNEDGRFNTELDAAIDSYQTINQRLIELGLGSTAEVSIVLYGSTADHLDMNPQAGGVQLSTTPNADADSSGRPDIEELLESITNTGHGLSVLTNYEAALHEAADLFNAIGTASGDGVIYFVTGSVPTTGGSYLGEVKQFRASGVDLRAIGLGSEAPMHDLLKLDPNASAVASRAEAVAAANLNQSAEPGLVGWTIYLDTNDNGQLDTGERSTLTAADDPATPFIDETGYYEFLSVGSGTHRVREIQQFGYRQSFPPRPDDHLVTLANGEFAEGIDFGNEPVPVGTLSGTMWKDANNDGAFDAGEEGHAGQTIYLDLNNNAQLDGGEPTTSTTVDGSYTFANVPFGTHIVREVVPAGFTRTFPNQFVVLDPDGTPNPTLGDVSPLIVDLNLVPGATTTQSVALTLPADSVSRKVDILLHMDASASFDFLVKGMAQTFVDLIDSIQTLFPEIDFAFGVSRHEEYGGFNLLGDVFGETVQRPFVLSQPIIEADTPGFLTAIEEALERETPGSGGDNNETLYEGLFHAATGRGFDADGDDDLLGSGVAGPFETQKTPGRSGDVPPFSSFQPDPDNDILPPAGNIGGVGFREGALPIIIAANDFGVRVNLDDTDPIVGLNGVTVPRDDFVAPFPSYNTPDVDSDGIDDGITVQQTIDALLDIGALVIGMGTQGFGGNRPMIEPLALLTGAINGTDQTIPSGDEEDPIEPGDPFYFRITNDVPQVTEAVQFAIEAAVSQTRHDIDVIASDPNVTITNLTGIAPQAGPGDTVSFDVEFTGESLPRRFDLQFVVAGTTAVLGSIPVEISTILAEPGAHVVTLAPGESAADLDFGNFAQTVATGVQARHVFYNHSAFDGNDPAANSADDAAIALDKSPLLPGLAAGFENYTSYARGINGIMVDLARSGSATITSADFQFRVGNADHTSAWNVAPLVKSITTRAGAGVNGSDRITIIWRDGAIRGQWLEVTVLTTAATELSSPDVFYFGNAPGETGGSSSDALVDAADFVATRANPSSFLAPAVIVDPHDHNRDRRVNATDLAIVRDYVTSAATALRLINVSSPLAAKRLSAEGEAVVIDRLPKKYSVAHTVADRQTLGGIITPPASDQDKAELIDRALASWSEPLVEAHETEIASVGDQSKHESLDEVFELD